MAKPIIPWMGGKRRLAKHILPLFPEHTCYVEPFAGAAALFFMKRPSKVEVINDVNRDLVTLYRVLQRYPETLLQEFKWSLNSRSEFYRQKDVRPETLLDIERAARFFLMQKQSFGGQGSHFGTSATRTHSFNIYRLEETLSAAHQRLASVVIEHLDWTKVITRYDRAHTLFYCDPPYWGTAGYGVPFKLDQYHLLAEAARSIKGKMVISVNDCPEMREAFNGMAMQPLSIKYTVGGNTPTNGNKTKPATELLIQSW